MKTQLSLFGYQPETKHRAWRTYVRLNPHFPIRIVEKDCVSQFVHGVDKSGRTTDINFTFFPEERKHVRMGSKKSLKRILKFMNFPDTSLQYLSGYSKFLCSSFHYRADTKNSSVKMWEKRYSRYMERWFLFGKPEVKPCFYVKANIISSMNDSKAEINYVYVPHSESLVELGLSLGRFSQRNLGFSGMNKSRILSAITKQCVRKAHNYDLFE